jgi:hypothetical protein
VVFCIEPSVRNLNRGPRARVIAVRNGDITSSACFIVGRGSDLMRCRGVDIEEVAWMALGIHRLGRTSATIRYCLVVSRFLIVFCT